MSVSRVLTGASVAVLLACGACSPQGAGSASTSPATPNTSAPASTAAVTTPAPATTPLSFERRTPDVEVSLTLPQQLAAYPAAHQQLFREQSGTLETFAREQGPERARAVREGAPFGPYWNVVRVSSASRSDRLEAFVEEASEFEGGAHPNSALSAILIDRRTGATIEPVSLFRSDADFSRLDRALCDAIHAARMQRNEGPLPADDASTFPCPSWRQSSFVPAPSTIAGKLGGLVFLFSPYAIGPYVEGPYEVTLPLSAFQAALKPEYAADFAGAPVRLPDRPELQTPSV